MTEAEWLACADPKKMLNFLRDKRGDRKFRLFACACCRHIWHLLRDERSRKAVDVAERFAEGTATEEELTQAENGANDVWNGLAYAEGDVTAAETDASDAACGAACYARGAIGAAGSASHSAAYALSYDGHRPAEQERQCRLLHDIFGNPFRPSPPLSIAVLAWNDGTVSHIAEGIYEERAFDRLPILADALLDAGCDNEELLAHCRSDGPHVRGCWAVDLILGKS
jgi:hypothetical protein